MRIGGYQFDTAPAVGVKGDRSGGFGGRGRREVSGRAQIRYHRRAMRKKSHLEAVVDWARLRLAARARATRGATTKKAAVALPAVPKNSPLAELAARYALDAAAVRVLALAWAAEESLDVARAARALSGGRGLSVEVVREVLGLDAGALERCLGAAGPLRARGLLAVGGVAGGTPGATAEVALAPGMAARLAGRAVRVADLAAGIETCEVESCESALPESLAALGAALAATGAVRASVGGAPRLARPVAAAARRDGRAAFVVDGRTVGALDAANCWAVMAAVRREAEIAGASLVVDGAAALGGAWRALVDPPLDESVAALVLLDEGSALAGASHPSLAIFEAAPAPAMPAPRPPPAPVVDAIEAARRQGAIDAARAMGRPFPTFPAGPPPTTARPTAETVTPAPTPAPVAATPPIPAPRPVAAPPPAEPNAPRIDPFSVEGTREPASRRRGRPAPAPEPRPAPAPPPVLAAPSVPEVAAVGDGDPAETNPRLDVPASVTVPELVALTAQATNPLQRADLLRRLGGLEQRDVAVVALLRAHLKAEHAAVRAAAEAGMAHFFGPNWNIARSIPKPVQPPRTED